MLMPIHIFDIIYLNNTLFSYEPKTLEKIVNILIINTQYYNSELYLKKVDELI